MPPRARSKSQSRVDPVRRACQVRRFHKAMVDEKSDLQDYFKPEVLADLDCLIGEADWDSVLGSEPEYVAGWREKKSLSSQLQWIKRWANEKRGESESQSRTGAENEAAEAPPDPGAVVIDGTAAVNMAAMHPATRIDYPGFDLPLRPTPSDSQRQNLPGIPTTSAPPVHNAAATTLPENGGSENPGRQSVDDQADTIASIGEHDQTKMEQDIARQQQEYLENKEKYRKIPQPYLNWLAARKDASTRHQEMKKTEQHYLAAEIDAKARQSVFATAERDFEIAQGAVKEAKSQQGNPSSARHSQAESHHQDANANAGPQLSRLREKRREVAETRNKALREWTSATRRQAVAHDSWVEARDAFHDAAAEEERRADDWERFRGVGQVQRPEGSSGRGNRE